MNIIYESKRLFFREMNFTDHILIKKILQNSEVMYAWEKIFSDQEVTEWIKRNRSRYKHDRYGYYLAIEKETGQLIGQIGLISESIEGQLLVGIGWILDKNFWGQGYATEGANATLAYAFDQFNIDEIVALIRPNNANSIRVAERLGMKLKGQYNKQVDEKIMPHLIYTLSREH